MITPEHIKAIEILLACERVDLTDHPIGGKIFFSIGGSVNETDLNRIHRECEEALTGEFLKRKTPSKVLS